MSDEELVRKVAEALCASDDEGGWDVQPDWARRLYLRSARVTVTIVREHDAEVTA